MLESIQAAIAEMPTWQCVLSIALCVLQIIAYWKIFTKAGQAGWKAIIPFLNTYTMFKIAYGNGWLFLLMLIPIVNIVITILFAIQLSKSFGKSGWFAVGLIFLETIFTLILGFDSSKYIGSKKDRDAGITPQNA